MTRYLYLHGFSSGPGSHKAAWLGARFAAQGARLEVPDLNDGDFSHLTLSRQIAVVEAHLAGDSGPVVLLGSSFGGYLATLLAERDPRFNRLVLLAPAFGFGDLLEQLFGATLMAQWRSAGRLRLPPEVDSAQRWLHYDVVEDLASHASDRLRRQPPALLCHGLDDATVPYAHSIEYLRTHRAAELLLLPDGHSLDDSLEAIWRHTAAFLGFAA